MSEQTGATREQIEAAAKRKFAADKERKGLLFDWDYVENSPVWLKGRCWEIEVIAQYLVPPGYRIVPADAVVVTPEIAARAAEACEATAENWYFSAKATAAGGDDHNTSRYLDKAARYRAAAAALRGGNSPNVTPEQNAWAEIEGGSIERAEAEASALREEG